MTSPDGTVAANCLVERPNGRMLINAQSLVFWVIWFFKNPKRFGLFDFLTKSFGAPHPEVKVFLKKKISRRRPRVGHDKEGGRGRFFKFIYKQIGVFVIFLLPCFVSRTLANYKSNQFKIVPQNFFEPGPGMLSEGGHWPHFEVRSPEVAVGNVKLLRKMGWL